MQYEPGVFPIANLENAGQRSQQIKGAKSKHYTNNENMYNMSHGIGGYSALAAMFGREDGSRAQGALYDLQDLSKLYQDKLRTTPVTALEQPVGSVTDISGNGNHAYQATAANRPIVSARYNLASLFSDPNSVNYAALFGAVTKTNNQLDPRGGNKAVLIEGNGNWGFGGTNGGLTTGVSYRGSLAVRSDSGGTVDFQVYDGTTVLNKTVELTTFWQRVHLDQVIAGTVMRVGVTKTSGQVSLQLADIDVRATADAALNIPAFQETRSNTDYDSNSFPKYLKGNGTTQFLQTDAIDFTGTDKMTVIAGVGKLSDAARATVMFHDAGAGQRITIEAPTGAGANNYLAGSGGTINAAASAAGYASPTINVVTDLGDISGDSVKLRVNGVQVAENTADQGTGTYSGASMYILANSIAGNVFGGRLYGLAICGRSVSPYPLFLAEEEMGSKMGIELS